MISIQETIIPIVLTLALASQSKAGYVYPQQIVPSIYSSSSTFGTTFAPTIAPTQAALAQTAQSRITSNNNQNRGSFRLVNPLNAGISFIDNNYLPDPASYVVDGRILKQYLVQEEQFDDILPPNDLGTNPVLLDDFTNIFEKYARLNQDFLQIRSSNGPSTIIQPVTRNHGPVALGSGSLGYIRRANGGVFLGSGSLGYISNQQRVNDVNDARAPKGTAPGPTSFGDSPTPILDLY